ncbi:MAG: HEAT repeat domain-containing protein, partial [Myxococcota bacterium]
MTSPQTAPLKTSPRTAPEATALLVELGRALRGRAYYETGARSVQTMLSRAIRLWLADLQRSGALELEVEEAGVRVPALTHRVPKLHLGGLAERLSEQGVRSLRFSETLDAEGLAAFIERLADPAGTNGDGGFARALYAYVPDGIVVNDEAPDRWAGTPAPSSPVPDSPGIEEIEPGPEIPPETFDDATRDVSGFDFHPSELRDDHDAGRTTAPGLDYSLSDADLELETDEAQLPAEPAPAEETPADTTDELQLEPQDEVGEDPAEPGDDQTEDLVAAPDTETARSEAASDPSVPEARHEDTDTDVLRVIPPEDTDATPALDPHGAGRWDQLCELLGDLERCTEDFRYHDLARRAGQLAGSLSDEGRSEAGIRAIRLFVQHAGDAAKRTPRQREVATEQLERLATGSRLDDLIALAAGEDAAVALDAGQLLLAAGEAVVAPLLRMALREKNPERRGHLQRILIALGDLLAPELLRALEAEDLGELRAAARLAGESQHPATVDRLEELLMHPDAPLRQEVAKALGRIGDARSTEALARALTCPLEGVPTSAAYCLGASGSGRAVEALLTALLASLESG